MSGNARAKRSRVPEFLCTNVRKIEPVGGHIVRLYISLERNGNWEDQCTILMSKGDIPVAAAFVSTAMREISGEADLSRDPVRH